MQIKSINIKNFRNLKDINITADENINIICGENGQGKTNILEALWLFTGAKSFRTSKEDAFINFGTNKAVNEIFFTSNKGKEKLKIEYSDKKTAFINDKKENNFTNIAGHFCAVVFSPDDLSLIKGGPNERRKFIDLTIGQIYPRYISILKNYNKALLQRNKIIKDYKYDKSLDILLDVFEKEIAENGEKIIKYRENIINKLSLPFEKIYSDLSEQKEKATIKYKPNEKGNLREKLKEKRKEDSLVGFTGIGPHRDDIEFLLNNINARLFASQGQQRSIVLSIKLSFAEIFKNISGEYPVCLLDDVMSELDEKRQNYIINQIKNMQVFITCCDPVNSKNLKSGKIIKIKNGEII